MKAMAAVYLDWCSMSVLRDAFGVSATVVYCGKFVQAWEFADFAVVAPVGVFFCSSEAVEG